MFVPDPGSEFFPSRIPDPNIFHPGSASKNLSILTPKKWFLSSRKYEPSCSSRIRILSFYPSRIPDPGVKNAPDAGSGSAQHCLRLLQVSDFGLHELRETAECESGCEGLQNYKLLWKAPELLRQAPWTKYVGKDTKP